MNGDGQKKYVCVETHSVSEVGSYVGEIRFVYLARPLLLIDSSHVSIFSLLL